MTTTTMQAPLSLVTVEQLSEMIGPGLSVAALRSQVWAAKERTLSDGRVIKANGLAPAIVRLGRKVLIDPDQYFAWLERHRGNRGTLTAGEDRQPPNQEMAMTDTVDSTSDQRVVNNVMRHKYRVLTDLEKAQMQELKDKGLEFVQLLYIIGGNPQHMDLTGAPQRSRELSLAQTKIEEAVMWAVKHITR